MHHGAIAKTIIQYNASLQYSIGLRHSEDRRGGVRGRSGPISLGGLLGETPIRQAKRFAGDIFAVQARINNKITQIIKQIQRKKPKEEEEEEGEETNPKQET